MPARPELELAATQALYAARLLERAIHDPGPWTFRWGTIEIPAERTITDAGILFEGTYPDLCHLEPPGDGLLLLCAGQVMAMRRVDHPGDTSIAIVWSLTTKHPVAP